MHILLLFILATFILLFKVYFEVTYYDLQRFYLLFIIFSVSGYFIKSSNTYKVTSTHLLFLFLFGVGFISAFINGYTQLGIIEILHFGSLLLFSTLISNEYSKKEITRFIYKFSVLFISVYLIYFTFGYFAHLSNSFSPLWPAQSLFSLSGLTSINFSDTLLFSYIRYFNHIQTWTFPLLFSLVLAAKQKQEKILLFFLLTIWWALLIQSGGRGTFVAVLFSLIIICFVFNQGRKQRLMIYFGSLISGFLAYLVMFYSLAAPFRDITREGSSGRIEMWERASTMFLENPFLGNGPLSYSIVEGNELHFAHPHNFYLQILAEWGLPALIILTSVILVSLYKAGNMVKSHAKPIIRELDTGILMSLIATLLHAGISQNLHSPISQLFLIIVLAWLFVYLSKNNSIFELKISFVSVFSVLLIVLFIYLNLDTISQVFNGYEVYYEDYGSNRLFPRIWGQGLNES